MIDTMIQINFNKEEITKLLNINPNEKNTRIINYMNNVFNNCNCYSIGRGKDLTFIAEIPSKSKDYFNLKLFLMKQYGFNSSYDYNLCLKLIHFLMNNKQTFSSLREMTDYISENYTNIEYYRNIMLEDLIAKNEQCKCQVFANGEKISYSEYEQVKKTFYKNFKKLEKLNCIKANDYLEIYFLDNGLNSDYKVIGTHDTSYDDTVYLLEMNNYELVEQGYMNDYLKNRLKELHTKLYGYENIKIETVYTLTHKYLIDTEFRQLVTNAFVYWRDNIK